MRRKKRQDKSITRVQRKTSHNIDSEPNITNIAAQKTHPEPDQLST